MIVCDIIVYIITQICVTHMIQHVIMKYHQNQCALPRLDLVCGSLPEAPRNAKRSPDAYPEEYVVSLCGGGEAEIEITPELMTYAFKHPQLVRRFSNIHNLESWNYFIDYLFNS